MNSIKSTIRMMVAGVVALSAVSFGQSWTVNGDLHAKGHVAGKNVSGVVMDMDGNVYHTIVIGNQEWTVENIRTTTLNDGTTLPHVTDSAAWATYGNNQDSAYCFYNNTTDPEERKKWGALYNWYAVKDGKLSPPPQAATPVATDWHVPTDADWTVLQNYLIANGYNHDGTTTGNKIAKSLATGNWTTSTNPGAIGNILSLNNRCGFSALPVGHRNPYGDFYGQNGEVHWWSTSEGQGRARYLGNSDERLIRGSMGPILGHSVRLVRDL